LATEIRRGQFATHYHELNELASIMPNVANQVTVKELPDQIVFCTKSNQEERIGRMVSKQAATGLPAPVIQRAKQVMGQIEKHSKNRIGTKECKFDARFPCLRQHKTGSLLG